MFRILADSLMTATRTGAWDAPDHWRQDTPAKDRGICPKGRDNRQLRRWLRDTGIL